MLLKLVVKCHPMGHPAMVSDCVLPSVRTNVGPHLQENEWLCEIQWSAECTEL